MSGPQHGKVVVGYLGRWSVYRPDGGSFDIENLDPSLCTHIVYSFAGLDPERDTIKSLDPWQDLTEDYGKGGYQRITRLKHKYPHLKVSLAIGGWNEGSINYSELAANPTRRSRFVTTAVDFIRKYNFDGLDLDWEYPGKRGGSPNDKQNFLLLVKELKSAFKKYNLLLTAAFGASKDTIDVAYDVAGLSVYLDYIHMMCYDYHGAWDKKTGVNAPLRSSDVLNVEYSINYMLQLGAPANKLVLGLPFYGRTFVLESTSAASAMGVAAKSTGFQGPYTRENGCMGYNEICLELKNNAANWTLHWDRQSSTPYAVSGNKFISYDNECSLGEKVSFAMKKGLAGVMAWSIDTDDFIGDCSGHLVKFPLMKSINQAISTMHHTDPHHEQVDVGYPDKSPVCRQDGGFSVIGDNEAMPTVNLTDSRHGKVVVVYLGRWAVYRPNGGSFDIENLDPTLCTHIIYSFAGLDPERDTIKSLDPWQDLTEDYGKGGYQRITRLKTKNPHLKVSLAIGGWNEGSTNYSELAANPTRRSRFVATAVDFIRKYNFDGLDLDWEYPGKRGGSPNDKQNFLLLVKELKSAFKNYNLLLTAAFGASKDTIDVAYDVGELSVYLDYIHLMCYDYHGAWDKKTGVNAPLRSSDVLNVEYSINYMLELGAPANKLVLGLPFYGRTFVLESTYGASAMGVAAKSTGFQGPYTRENGCIGYNEICLELKNNAANWTLHWDTQSSTPYAVSDDKFISYDNERSLREKVLFAMEKGLAGVMAWSIDTDDFNGDCSGQLIKFPLMKCINQAISTARHTDSRHAKVVVVYLGRWAVYRPNEGSFDIENLDPSLCTHIVYSFAGLDPERDSIKSLDPWQDLTEDYGKGGYQRITRLKNKYPHLKLSLAIGGWNEGSTNYSELAANPTRRSRFVANAVDFIRKYNFDGLDLDWEYPGKRGGSPNDKHNFLLLVKELKSAFKKYNLLLTAAFGASKDTIDVAYDVGELSVYLDYIHLMCYDYHGAWDKKTGVNAPLRSSDVLNVEYSINYMLELGAPANKLVLGLPFYGRTFVLESTSGASAMGVAAKSTGFQGPYTRENGFMGYNEICLELKNNAANWTLHWDTQSSTPYAVSENKFISFDNERSLREKVLFAMKKSLAGVMAWSVDTDDFNGDCSGHLIKFPLMKCINHAISRTYFTDPHHEQVDVHYPHRSPVFRQDGGSFTMKDINEAMSTSHLTDSQHGKVVVVYLGSWSVYRPNGGSFNIENLDPSLCTHIVYSFAGLDLERDTIKSLDPWQDLTEDFGKGGYQRITRLKNKYPHLKVSLAIGGWVEGSINYSKLAADPARRSRFVATSVDFIRKYNFDGLDLVWQYPGKRGGFSNDKQNFLQLVKELKLAFKKHNLLLTAAFGASKDTIDLAYDVAGLSVYLDYIHLMCYDYHGTWDKKTGVNAPLRSSDILNVEYSINYMLDLGAPANKLVLGLPFYGRSFVLGSSSGVPALGVSAKSIGFKGPYTQENGFMGYNEICLELKNNVADWTLHWDSQSSTPYAVSGNKFISYDNERSISEKVRYAVNKGLAGVMAWSIDTDDFNGYSGHRFPLMKCINKVISN